MISEGVDGDRSVAGGAGTDGSTTRNAAPASATTAARTAPVVRS
ncbi:hypothetical protein [Haloplanus halophilus]|nr:hypothetical protein [Haloplanus sp. GDY1]